MTRTPLLIRVFCILTLEYSLHPFSARYIFHIVYVYFVLRTSLLLYHKGIVSPYAFGSSVTVSFALQIILCIFCTLLITLP